ncbi:TIGR03086 family metal-binding protein [Actinopolymorpha singaporensis]|uniref:TIGR03086 family protein n=1 Tax=Actinopolymorpha singaporensis TaxID=117157 RepID=A0A1H1QDB2_9ACTN|nr:TIGR03086 family metal-binding protein [Actinopolymorpha singaporensis]SDS21482.1 TIGR03086 family protein [Actinopolymorpha singaporensis]
MDIAGSVGQGVYDVVRTTNTTFGRPSVGRMFDLGPATRRLGVLVSGVREDQLQAPTPCEGYTVGDLLDHIGGLAMAFTAAARKVTMEGVPDGPPQASADNLPADWQESIPRQLAELAAAWSDPAAYEGQAHAGGLTLPAQVAGMVALEECVLHGWDLARATAQPFDVDEESTKVVFEFTSMAASSEQMSNREGLFGAVVDVPADAPMFERALGLSGRDPKWSA